jgi:hypothetical protein
MDMRFRRYFGAPAFLLLLPFLGLVTTPARADTTVADYLKLEKAGQADLLGRLLQSLADDLQANNRDKEAECLAGLYTVRSEARVARSPGMMDFLQSIDIARESDPKDITIEEIIARQLLQYCGHKPAKKK